MRVVPMMAQPMKGQPSSREVAEPKLDGIRVVVDKRGSDLSIYTRTLHEQRGKFPHLEAAFLRVPFDFTLDGELVSVTSMEELEGQIVPIPDFSNVASIVGSGTARAIQSQRTRKLHFVVFDCMNAQGKDLTDLPDVLRRGAAELLVELLNTWTEYVMLIPRWTTVPDGLMEALVAMGGEGLMYKNPLAAYRAGQRPANTWMKCKAVSTADVVIMGYKPGLGKYAGMVGAIEFGQYRNGRLMPCGDKDKPSHCSGMDDEFRAELTNNGSAWIGKAIEIAYNGRTGPERSFRHPRFLRVRSDKAATDCEWE